MGKVRITSASTSNNNNGTGTAPTPTPTPTPTPPRVERKIIEKNRRNRMKNLYSDLISLLLPDHHSKLEGLPLPDQIDEAVAYIKSLNMKLDKYRLKKESLLRKKASNSCPTTASSEQSTNTRVQVHNMAPNIDLILVNGLEDFSKFHNIIRQANHNGDEIATASFIRYGNSTVQILHDNNNNNTVAGKNSNSATLEGATTPTRKPKDELVCGGSSNSQFSGLDAWDYEIESNIWGFEFADADTSILGI